MAVTRVLTNNTHSVADIHGDQIQVNGQWFHAERIFGKPASQYRVGQLVEEMSQANNGDRSAVKPDELVCSALYRGCSSTEMNEHKLLAFVQVMLAAGGYGEFPMIAGYIETLDVNDVEQCKSLVAEDRTNVWLAELGWSRLVAHTDIGTRYVHIDNGHHRMAAAAIASTQLGPIFVPVADLRREEDLPRFMTSRP